jgi:hypothetical protein
MSPRRKKTLRSKMARWVWARVTSRASTMLDTMIFSLAASPSSRYTTWSSSRSGSGGVSGTRSLVNMSATVVTTRLMTKNTAASSVFSSSSGKCSLAVEGSPSSSSPSPSSSSRSRLPSCEPSLSTGE